MKQNIKQWSLIKKKKAFIFFLRVFEVLPF